MMGAICLSLKNQLFRQSLKLFLEGQEGTREICQCESMDELINQPCLPEVVIADFPADLSGHAPFDKLIKAFPEAKILVIGSSFSSDDYRNLIAAGIKGSVLYSAGLPSLINALHEIRLGRICFPNEALQQIMLKRQPKQGKPANGLTERESEILRLLCDGMSNEQISEMLHLSCDTIKWHRSNILVKCECKNILSLYKYALKKKLVHVPKIR